MSISISLLVYIGELRDINGFLPDLCLKGSQTTSWLQAKGVSLSILEPVIARFQKRVRLSLLIRWTEGRVPIGPCHPCRVLVRRANPTLNQGRKTLMEAQEPGRGPHIEMDGWPSSGRCGWSISRHRRVWNKEQPKEGARRERERHHAFRYTSPVSHGCGGCARRTSRDSSCDTELLSRVVGRRDTGVWLWFYPG